MADDVVLNKIGIIERCLQRVREEYENDRSRCFFTRRNGCLLKLPETRVVYPGRPFCSTIIRPTLPERHEKRLASRVQRGNR